MADDLDHPSISDVIVGHVGEDRCDDDAQDCPSTGYLELPQIACGVDAAYDRRLLREAAFRALL